MKALILTAGQETRLRPLSYITPKALLDVKEKPVLGHILDNFDGSVHLDEIIVLYAHKYKNQFKEFEKYYPHQKKIKFINDNQKNHQDHPGLIGSIAHVVKYERIEGPLLVAAGDNLYGFPIDNFINFHITNKQKTCIAVHEFEHKSRVAGKYGVVELDENSLRIKGFEEKPYHPKTKLASTLCYILSKEDLHHLDKNILKKDAGDLIKHFIDGGQEVYAFEFREKWFDIGTYNDLMTARREF